MGLKEKAYVNGCDEDRTGVGKNAANASANASAKPTTAAESAASAATADGTAECDEASARAVTATTARSA